MNSGLLIVALVLALMVFSLLPSPPERHPFSGRVATYVANAVSKFAQLSLSIVNRKYWFSRHSVFVCLSAAAVAAAMLLSSTAFTRQTTELLRESETGPNSRLEARRATRNNFIESHFSGEVPSPPASRLPTEFPTSECASRSERVGGRIVRPGEPILDDRENVVHAHGGGMLVPHQAGGPNERYYWYGESAKNESGVLPASVLCYSSSDLLAWRFEGVVLDALAVTNALRRSSSSSSSSGGVSGGGGGVSGRGRQGHRVLEGANGLGKDTLNDSFVNPAQAPPHVERERHRRQRSGSSSSFKPTSGLADVPRVVLERPKVVYCPTTRLFVMWFHLDHYRPQVDHDKQARGHPQQQPFAGRSLQDAAVAAAVAPVVDYTASSNSTTSADRDSEKTTNSKGGNSSSSANGSSGSSSSSSDNGNSGSSGKPPAVPPRKYHWRRAGVATSKFAVGPFTFVAVREPDGKPSLDLTLHQLLRSDGHGGRAGDAFLVRSVDNKYVAVSKLRDADFLDTEEYGEGDDNRTVFGSRTKRPLSETAGPLEGMGLFSPSPGAPTYLLASHLHGWVASPLELLRLRNPSLAHRETEERATLRIMPKDHDQPPPSLQNSSSSAPFESRAANSDFLKRQGGRGWEEDEDADARLELRPTTSKTSHRSQCAFILPYCDARGKPYFIYIGDRWNVQWWHASPLAGLSTATYVMLPLLVNSSGSVLLPWRDSWDLDDPFPGGVDAYPRWLEDPTPPPKAPAHLRGGGGGEGGGSGDRKWALKHQQQKASKKQKAREQLARSIDREMFGGGGGAADKRGAESRSKAASNSRIVSSGTSSSIYSNNNRRDSEIAGSSSFDMPTAETEGGTEVGDEESLPVLTVIATLVAEAN